MTNDKDMRRVYAPIPAGGIKPGGMLWAWQNRLANSWTMSYAKNRDPGVYGKFWNRNQTHEVVFDDNDQTLTLCDYTAYFADGLVRYAVLNPGSEVEREWLDWMHMLFESQDEDGYIGAFVPSARWKHWLEIISQSLCLDALLCWQQHTGDAEALERCEKAMRCMMRAWFDRLGEPSIFSGHGTVSVRTASTLYQITGNEDYRGFARSVFEKYGHTQAYLTEDDALIHKHNVVETEHVGLPAFMYELCGEQRHLDAAKRAYSMMEKHLCVDGQPHGGEMMTHTGSRINCEHCSAVEFFVIADELARVTGEVKYMDAAERCMLNAYPAAKTEDGMMLAYSHTPNQLVASEWSVPHNNEIYVDWWASRQFYSSAHEPLCCNSNSPRGLPLYIDAMAALSEDGLAVMYYGSFDVSANIGGCEVCVSVDSAYPYEDEVRITVNPEKPFNFGLQLRIPGFCDGAELYINGEPHRPVPKPGEMALLSREWRPGDNVLIRFINSVRILKTRRPEFGVRAATCAVYRGALLYALPVDEEWQYYKAPASGPGTDIVSSRVVMAKGCKWNYALVLDENAPESAFTFELSNVAGVGVPFAGESPAKLRVRARRVENWLQEGDDEHVMTPGAPIMPMKFSGHSEEITLIPYGHTHLRMTMLPFLEEVAET